MHLCRSNDGCRGSGGVPRVGAASAVRPLPDRKRRRRNRARRVSALGGWAAESKAIAIDRETAVLVDDSAQATIVANADHATPYAYFIRGGVPQVVAAKMPLTYLNVRVDRAAPGSTFDLQRDWLDLTKVSRSRHRHQRGASSTRPHDLRSVLSLESNAPRRGKDTPDDRPIAGTSTGPIVEIPEVGGLHHRYERRAA